MNAKKMLIGTFALALLAAVPALPVFADSQDCKCQNAACKSEVSEKDIIAQASGLLDTALKSNRRAKVAQALKAADGVLIFPFVNESGSEGILLHRNKNGWSGPAFVVVDEKTADALGGNGWIIPIDKSGMEVFTMRSDDEKTPDSEGLKSTVGQQGFSMYRDKVNASTMIEEIGIHPAAISNENWWGKSVFLSQALEGKPNADLKGLVQKLQTLSR